MSRGPFGTYSAARCGWQARRGTSSVRAVDHPGCYPRRFVETFGERVGQDRRTGMSSYPRQSRGPYGLEQQLRGPEAAHGEDAGGVTDSGAIAFTPFDHIEKVDIDLTDLKRDRMSGSQGLQSTHPTPIRHTATIKADFQLVGLAVRHSLGLVVGGSDDLVGVLFRVVKSQAADREIGDFMTVPRSRPG